MDSRIFTIAMWLNGLFAVLALPLMDGQSFMFICLAAIFYHLREKEDG